LCTGTRALYREHACLGRDHRQNYLAQVRRWGERPVEITLVGSDGTPWVVDRHGVIHCGYCGRPTNRVELRRAAGATLGSSSSACSLRTRSPWNELQSLPCELGWRMLAELPRNDDCYFALESSN
jgi:hypothetical protein